MTNTEKFLAGLGVVALALTGGLYFNKSASQPAPVSVVNNVTGGQGGQVAPLASVSPDENLGASSGNEHFQREYFYNGISLSTTGTGSTIARGGAKRILHFLIPAGSTEVSVSSSIVSVTGSTIIVWPELTSPISPQQTCNTSATATPILKYVSVQSNSSSGFVVAERLAPTVNPECIGALILDNSFNNY